MKTQDIIEEIKLELTGQLLELEIDDSTIELCIKKSLRELERYWDETKLVTVPFASCIDMSGFNSSMVVRVYRTEGVGDIDMTAGSADPMYMQQ